MLYTNQLIDHMRDKHQISINDNHIHNLRCIGYYHGYKGYRYIREPKNKIKFSFFDEISALNDFDLNLKSLFYPKIMFIETAIKNYVIEAVLKDSKSENLDDIFNKSVTRYKYCKNNNSSYKTEYTKRMQLKVKISSSLIRDYVNNKKIVNHFFNNDRAIPIWAVFESLSLGEFGTFFSCCNKNVRLYTSNLLNLPTNFDNDGEILKFMIYAIKDLRNSIAHNNIIFDTRFKTAKINKRLEKLLKHETNIKNLDFKYIDTYIILVIYLLVHMHQELSLCNEFLDNYLKLVENLRLSLPSNICDKILGTQTISNIELAKKYLLKNSSIE